MKGYLLLAVLIYIVVPAAIAAAVIYSYRTKRRILRWTAWIPVLVFGVFLGGIIGNEVEDFKRQRRMADEAGNLMTCATLLREGDMERGIKALDEEIGWRLKASAWGKDMRKLPEETLYVWQDAKVYYDKYEVTGISYIAPEIRTRLKEVPWSQREADRRAFEAKYKGDTPQIAPDLDIAEWPGPSLSLESLRGKVVLLDFWGLRCKPCIAAFPKVQELHDKFKESGLTVIAVHGWGGGVENVSRFMKDNKYSFAVAIDGGKTVRDYAVSAIPSYYLIDKKGRLVWGPEHGVPLEEQIESLLKD
jgi:thiol-disulfide isomerase/thioredoxin